MTNTYAPELTSQQIVNSIYYWINQNTWAPGIAFPAGPTLPTTSMHNTDFFYDTTNSHLWQYQGGDYPSGQWVDLGTAANAITSCGTTLPGSANELDLFNKYDEGNIYQWITANGVGGWRNIGSNTGGLPLGADAIIFTDLSKTWRSARLGLLLTSDTGSSPILATDQGFTAKKDIAAGGFISTNQGQVWIGHGMNNETDNPKIVMMDSGQGYNTLYLTQVDGSTPANLDLGNLTSHGNMIVTGNAIMPSSDNTSSVGTSTNMFQNMYTRSLIVGNHSAGNYLTFSIDSTGVNLVMTSSNNSGAILPSPDKALNLGSSSQTWNNVYCQYLTANSISVANETLTSNLAFNGSNNSIQLPSGGWLQWGSPNAKLAAAQGTRGFNGAWGLSVQTGSGSLGLILTSNMQVDHIDSATGGGITLFDKIATSSTYPFKTSNNILDDGSGNITLSGTGINGSLYSSGGHFVASSASNGNLVLDAGPSGGIYFRFDSTLGNISSYTTVVVVSSTGLNPAASNTYGCGGGSNYWRGGCFYTVYYHSLSQSLDSLDDLEIIKGYKTKQGIHPSTGQSISVVDLETIPQIRADSTPNDPDLVNFIDSSKMMHLLLGATKQAAFKHDKHEAVEADLLRRIENLEKKLA